MSDYLKIDSFRLQQASCRSSAGTAPSGRDIDDFERAMQRPDERRESGGQQADQDNEDMNAFSGAGQGNMPMSSPLDGLFANRMGAMSEMTEMSSPDSTELANKLLERILVAEPESGGSEIRLMLNDDVLPGTEIRLLRGVDGFLSVSLVTDNATSFQTLVAAQDSLRRQLEGMEKNVHVEVTSETAGSGAEHNDTRQRSRGLLYEEGQE